MAKILSGGITVTFTMDASGVLETIVNYEAVTPDNNLKGSLALTLTLAQDTQIRSFITNVVVPSIKTWEGIA